MASKVSTISKAHFVPFLLATYTAFTFPLRLFVEAKYREGKTG